ncbi:MAG: hypothetical protein II913_05575 [Elusimicrobiaceae bacterium]|nr:hypothetical protein [Elusimicrobiaceae bacterium]
MQKKTTNYRISHFRNPCNNRRPSTPYGADAKADDYSVDGNVLGLTALRCAGFPCTSSK